MTLTRKNGITELTLFTGHRRYLTVSYSAWFLFVRLWRGGVVWEDNKHNFHPSAKCWCSWEKTDLLSWSRYGGLMAFLGLALK